MQCFIAVENPYQDEDILDSLNISYSDDKIDMHVPYENSGDTPKILNETNDKDNTGIIMKDSTGENDSKTNEDISSWPDSFLDISIEDTTEITDRKCLKTVISTFFFAATETFE